jgi:PAS domain-containing protein
MDCVHFQASVSAVLNLTGCYILNTSTGYLCFQYMNRSSERFLGFNMKDVAGKSLLETNSVDNKELMVQQLQRGREWEGLISWRRKMGDSVVLSGRVIPVCSPGR